MKKKIVCFGYGWVGKEVCALFPEALVYDPILEQKRASTSNLAYNFNASSYPNDFCTKEQADECDIAFVAVPSPALPNGKLDTTIVEEVVSKCQCPLIVIRSTVNPGTCDYLSWKYSKRIVMQPEYLGETPAHPLMQMKERPFLILGGAKENTRELIELYTTVYNANVTIRQVTAMEAEVIKLSENRAIAFKVMQCHELFLACEKAGLDYYTIRDAVYGDDPRFNLWWTFVYPGNLGFNSSKCLVKDVPAWCAWAESIGGSYAASLTQALVEKSTNWNKSK